MYRGRISNKQGYNNLQMGAPPYEKNTGWKNQFTGD